MKPDLWGQPFETKEDVRRILREKAWSIAHHMQPGYEQYVWPSVFNAMQDALQAGSTHAEALKPLLFGRDPFADEGAA